MGPRIELLITSISVYRDGETEDVRMQLNRIGTAHLPADLSNHPRSVGRSFLQGRQDWIKASIQKPGGYARTNSRPFLEGKKKRR